MEKRILVTGLVFLLLFSSVVPISIGYNVNMPDIKVQSYNRGKTLYVGGSGPNNYTEIQDAIDNSSNGDTVFVYDDRSPYYEVIVINKSINVIGEKKTTTIIDCRDIFNKEAVFINADNVSISGFTIYNYSKEAILDKANYTHITNNILGLNKSGWSGDGICLSHANNNLIEDNELSRMFDDSIDILYSNNNCIRKNYINSSHLYGIWLSAATNNQVDGNIIDTGFDFISPGGNSGIQLTSSNNNTLINNRIISYNKEYVNGVMLWDSQNNTVIGNAFTSCGLEWWGSYENIIENNTVNNNPLFYIIGKPYTVIDKAGQVILIKCHGSMIHNVTISNTPKAIELIDSNNCNIINCTCLNNKYGIYIELSSNNQIMENIVINNKYGINIESGSSHTRIIKNDIQDNFYIGIYSNAAYTSIEQNHLFNNSAGIIIDGNSALRTSIIANNITKNWDGIILSSISTIVTKNIIRDNRNGIQINGGSIRNQIISNNISNNEFGINFTYEPDTPWSFYNLIDKNNFIGNIWQSYFDSSIANQFIGNYWGGDIIPPYRIDGILSFYRVDPWGGVIWEKHIPWMAFDWHPAKEPYDI